MIKVQTEDVSIPHKDRQVTERAGLLVVGPGEEAVEVEEGEGEVGVAIDTSVRDTVVLGIDTLSQVGQIVAVVLTVGVGVKVLQLTTEYLLQHRAWVPGETKRGRHPSPSGRTKVGTVGTGGVVGTGQGTCHGIGTRQEIRVVGAVGTRHHQ